MSSNQQRYENPTYDDVCSGQTSLVEVYQMNYLEHEEKEMKMYQRLVWHYFSFHDPTTWNRQGPIPFLHLVMVMDCHTYGRS